MDAAFVTDGDGHTSLVCGSKAVSSSPSKVRSIASKAARFSDSKELEAYAMYAIADAATIKEVLKDYLPMIK